MRLVFVVQAYANHTPMGALEDVVTLELFADSEKAAIARAKTIIERAYYRVSSVIEKD